MLKLTNVGNKFINHTSSLPVSIEQNHTDDFDEYHLRTLAQASLFTVKSCTQNYQVVVLLSHYSFLYITYSLFASQLFISFNNILILQSNLLQHGSRTHS